MQSPPPAPPRTLQRISLGYDRHWNRFWARGSLPNGPPGALLTQDMPIAELCRGMTHPADPAVRPPGHDRHWNRFWALGSLPNGPTGELHLACLLRWAVCGMHCTMGLAALQKPAASLCRQTLLRVPLGYQQGHCGQARSDGPADLAHAQLGLSQTAAA